jgi:protein SCO1
MQRRKSTLIRLVSALLAFWCAGARHASAASWGANYFPNIPLTAQDGTTVHFYEDLLKGKRVIINFIYTRCGDSCPLETARLAQVKNILGDHMGRDIFFYSLSLDPEHDTPAELKSYAEKFHAGPGWLFLTGKKDDIELVRRKLGQAARPGENPLTAHSTSFMIGNELTGEWIKDSSLDDPRYIATIVRDWFSGGKREKPAGGNYAQAPAVPEYVADKGGYLFHVQCSACHTIGNGDGIGPDLKGVTHARDRAWLSHFIQAPNELLEQKDSTATALFAKYKQLRMPNLRLGDVDVNAIISYLEKQNAAGGADGHITQ